MHRFEILNQELGQKQYENRECDLDLFTRVAGGESVLAAIDDQREVRDWPTGNIYYIGVFDMDEGKFVNNLTPEQAAVVYVSWDRLEHP